MLTDEPDVRKALRRMVVKLEENFHARQDLLQEAFVYLWSRELQYPRQERSWHLQSVDFHLRHLRASGRSLDSYKRHCAQASFPDQCDKWDHWRDSVEFDQGFLSALVARDIVTLLLDQLGPTDQLILRARLEGLGNSEIAGALHVPRGFVDRHRLRIAKLAVKLGLKPARANPPQPGGCA